MESLPLLIMIIGLTIGLGFAAASVDAREVKADWANRRCDPLVIAGGFMYKPDSDKRSSSEFAFDNFKFCTERFVKHTIMGSLTPFFALFKPIIGLASGVSKVFNGLRQMLHSMYNSFLQIIGKFYKIFERYIIETSRVTQLLKASFGKINASLTASIYMAISLMTAGYNAFKFMILVTQIILGILSGLSIILFFVLAPFGSLIAAVTAAISIAVNTVIGVAMGDGFENQNITKDAFCFTGDTLIQMSNGITKKISELSAGEKLANGFGYLQGMLYCDGSRVDLYNYQGILVSGEHLVFEEGKYIRVADSSVARQTTVKAERLFCPVTTSQKVPIIGNQGIITFADWEEMNEEEAEAAWQKAVCDKLNAGEANCCLGEIGGDVSVMCASRGKISIRDIQIGDCIDYINNKGIIDTTRVLGVYKGNATTLGESTDIGCGVWIGDSEHKWYKHNKLHLNPGLVAYHLITESGTFLALKKGQLIHVRDFTEVGLHNLPSLTPQVITKLNA